MFSRLRALGRSPLLSVSSDELFDEKFQRKLESLAIVSKRLFSGRTRAERRTKRSGAGIEFIDHRDYTEGDDLRFLDWNLYQRFGKLLVRLYEEEEDLSISLIVDTSASMGFGTGEKLRQAKRIAAALAYVGLSNLDRVGLVAAAGTSTSTLPPTRGKQRILRIFEFLRPLRATGTTDLGDAMKAFVARHKRRGLAVLLSDLYDPAGFERGINVLRYNRFEPLVIQLVDRTEARPKLAGDVRLVDCETGDHREITVTADLLRRFTQAYDNYLTDVERFCATKQVPYFCADTTVPFEELVLRLFRRGGFLR